MSMCKSVALSVCALAAMAGSSQGGVLFSGSSGSLAASAMFEVSGSGQLVVTLTNTSSADVTVPAEVLTAVFFDLTGPTESFTRDSGLLAPGSVVVYDPDGQPAGGVIGGEWAYASGALNIGAPGTRAYGISSTGIGLFGPGDRFPGADLEPPTNPDGPQYGILSAGDDVATGNGGITGSGGMIKNAAVFSLGNAGANFDLSRIQNVYFFYGTALGEGGFIGVPTPGAASLLGAAGLIGLRRRR
ncbi:MAG: PEP-CTERM sorting domain-containing protein [Planctomycetes bacterium]|nr:PEP-CTERM sorting domain-containing protein [Planctomycetota bacterium]